MPAYMVFIRENPVHDSEEMAVYQAMNRENVPAFMPFNIKPLVVYGATEAIEGDAPDGINILEFPTVEDAKAFYNSPEYQRSLPHRVSAAEYRAFIVQGL
jgi:uncharacterized protein (DUF1330 family)